VGRRIAALEESLGVRLLQRTTDGYALTPAGERFLPRAERIEAELHATALELRGQESRLTGSVRLTTPDAYGPSFVVPLLADLHGRFPEIDLEIVADNRRLNLSKREADMAIRTGRPKEPSMISRYLSPFGYALYASPAYLAARGRPRGDDLTGHDLVSIDESVGSSREATWLQQRAKRARVMFRSNSTFALLSAALGGMGVAVLPCYLAAQHDLVRLLPPEDVVVKELWLVLHKDLRHAARIRATVGFLVESHAARAQLLAGSARAARRRS
jgi:DNA-binding transcriptional LysR family regulator